MMKHIDVDYCKKETELVPGGDLRCKANQWFRAAWRDSSVRLPRESQFRLLVRKIARKKALCP